MKLEPAQKTAFAAYVSSLSPRRLPNLSADQFSALTYPSRIDYMAVRIQADLTEVQRQATALREFYSLLSVEQRRQLDETTRSNKGQLGVAAGVAPIAAPERPDYKLPSHTDPSWMIRPNADDVSRVYPSKALAGKFGGSAQMTCVADEDGYLKDCLIVEENPKDVGFGNAALELSAYMRMNPATNYGIPTESQVNVPVRFAPEQDVGPAPDRPPP